MRALVITEHGPPEVLRVQERPDPEPGPGEVRVRVRAAGINFADLMARVGLYPEAPKPPCVVGYEIAGEVESLGEEVEGMSLGAHPATPGASAVSLGAHPATPGASARLQLGQRVMGGCRFGGYAELVVTGARELVPLPEHWNYAEGAALPVTYSTAYAALIRYGGLRAGERILIQSAAGGVGISATQIAKIVGAEVFGAASPPKHDAIRRFGVDHPVDYRTHDVVDEVRRITGEERPLDLVMDAVGGRSFKQSYSLLRAGGRLVCFGASEVQAGERRSRMRALRVVAQMPRFGPLKLMSESKAVIGLNMLALWDAKGTLQEYVGPLRAWIDEGRLRPVVARAFPLEQGPDAHRYLHARENIGKVVLEL